MTNFDICTAILEFLGNGDATRAEVTAELRDLVSLHAIEAALDDLNDAGKFVSWLATNGDSDEDILTLQGVA